MAQHSIAFLIHELAPYRMHLLRRFRNELPIKSLDVILTSTVGGFDWQLDRPSGIQWHDLSQGASILHQGKPAQFLRERRKARCIAAKIADIHPSAVIVCGYGDAAHRYAIRYCHRKGIPVLLWADSNIRSEPSRGLRRALKHLLLPRLLRQCDAVLPWGTLGKQYFLKYGVPENRIVIVPAEPDYAVIENCPPADIAAARERFHLSPERRRFLFVGRLAAEKRVDLLITAFAQVAKERPDWDLLIVGDGPLRETMQAMVPQTLRPRIAFTGAMISPKALAPYYHLADIFVLPSDHEPWGIVVNEAAAAGLPLVCSDIVGAAGNLLREGENGKGFPSRSLEGLVAAMLATSGQPPERLRNGSRSILTQWRKTTDPVGGLRESLELTGVLGS